MAGPQQTTQQQAPQETPEQLMARMKATYGVPNSSAPQQPQQPVRPQPAAPQPAAQPQDPLTWGESRRALRQGNFADGGQIPEWTFPEFHADGGAVGLGASAQQGSAPMLAMRFADGGQIPGQAPGMPQAGGQSQILDPQMAQMQLQDFVGSNPQGGQMVAQAIQQGIQSGEITEQQIQLIEQLCQACVNNPKLWPNVRAYAVKAGLCEPNDLPPQYDQGLVLAILAGIRAAQQHGPAAQGQQPQGGQVVQGTMQAPQAHANGGMIHGPGTGTSDSIHTQNRATGAPVSVSTGEYVIPADVVRAKGKDFFDKMVRQYHQPTGFKG